MLLIHLNQFINILIQISERVSSTNWAFHAHFSLGLIELEDVGATLVEHVLHTVQAHVMLAWIFWQLTGLGHETQANWTFLLDQW